MKARLARLIGRIADGVEEVPAIFGLGEAVDLAKR